MTAKECVSRRHADEFGRGFRYSPKAIPRSVVVELLGDMYGRKTHDIDMAASQQTVAGSPPSTTDLVGISSKRWGKPPEA